MSSQVSPHSHSTMEIFFSCDNEEMQKTSPACGRCVITQQRVGCLCSSPVRAGGSCSRQPVPPGMSIPGEIIPHSAQPGAAAWGDLVCVVPPTAGVGKQGWVNLKKSPSPFQCLKRASVEKMGPWEQLCCARGKEDGVPDVSSWAKNAVG